jgi:hypothetical protein
VVRVLVGHAASCHLSPLDSRAAASLMVAADPRVNVLRSREGKTAE